MTVEEFKKLKPEYEKVEGNQLWDAMEDYILSQQQGDEIIKLIMPIWKTHTLRWLHYRRIPSWIMSKPNTNISHKLYKFGKRISKLFWILLDKLHLVRSSIIGRYDMFGDESRYVKSWVMNMKTGKMSKNLKKRKWWEYILIEKSFHNF